MYFCFMQKLCSIQRHGEDKLEITMEDHLVKLQVCLRSCAFKALGVPSTLDIQRKSNLSCAQAIFRAASGYISMALSVPV